MTWLSIVTIIMVALSGLANLFLAAYVYKKNPKDRLSASFFYFGLSISLWCFAEAISLVFKTPFWQKLDYSVPSVLPLTGLFFCYALADKKINKWIKISLLAVAAIIFVVILATPLFIKGIAYSAASVCEPDIGSGLGCEVILGPYFNFFLAYVVLLTFLAIYTPYRAMRKVSLQRRKQILYFLAGAIIFAFWSIVVSIVLPVFGFNQLTDFDSIASIFLIGFTSYAIIRYNLMDIKSLFFQAFIYSLVIVLIVLVLLLLMFVGVFFLENLLVWPIYIMAVLISIALFFIGRLFFTEKRDLEKTKIDLTKMLAQSEQNRLKTEIERDRTSRIIESFSDGIIILDEKDEIISVNPEAEKIIEADKNKLLRKPLRALEDFPKSKPVALVLYDGLENISRKEVKLSKDFVAELSVAPLNLNENDIGHLIVLRDVSREKIVDKMKTEFVSLAAHQLRTPLSIIKWSMSMLKNGDMGKLTKKQDDVVKNTFKNNERLISIVNDLLDVTRIEEGRYLYKVAPADIRKIVDSVIDDYKDEIKNKKIKIGLIKPDNLPDIMVDQEKIKLVAQNFIDNAIKYSPKGGNIIITLEDDRTDVKVRVQDFGIGIPQAQQDKIFTKFFRGDNAIKINTTGSGLGLFLAQNIVEAHGGKIWFESEENIGTSFYFTLPIKRK